MAVTGQQESKNMTSSEFFQVMTEVLTAASEDLGPTPTESFSEQQRRISPEAPCLKNSGFQNSHLLF